MVVDEYRTFLFSYRHEGSVWCLEIKARDQEDARARLAKLPYATLDGELMAKIPVRSGILQRVAVTLARLFGRRPVGELPRMKRG